MKETLQVINAMQAAGVLGQYALGGAIAATFYLEPVATQDIDVFVSFASSSDSPLLSLEPIYNYLRKIGCSVEGEHVLIRGWHVQFLPPVGPLCEEALLEAIQTDVDGVTVRVMRAEHLVALALQLGRPKDRARIVLFVEAGHLDPELLQQILKRHNLLAKWQEFSDRYLSGQ